MGPDSRPRGYLLDILVDSDRWPRSGVRAEGRTRKSPERLFQPSEKMASVVGQVRLILYGIDQG